MEIPFEEMENGSFYTIIGAGGDINEWIFAYEKALQEQGIGIPEKWIIFHGSDMNSHYNLTGNTKYSDDLVFLAFPLDGLSMNIALFKIKMEDHWFDDIVENNKNE